MNGKYMRWAEQRWNDREQERLQRMEEHRIKKEKRLAMQGDAYNEYLMATGGKRNDNEVKKS